MAENFLLELSQDIGQLFSTKDNYDVIIQAGEGQNMKEFFAHSLILSARSTYFKTALSEEQTKKENGIINFDRQNVTQILKLLSAAKNLSLQKLYDYIETYSIDNQVLRNDPVEFIQFMYQYEIKDCLKNVRNDNSAGIIVGLIFAIMFGGFIDHCLDIICENPKKFFESPLSISLEQEFIIHLLEKDEFDAEEIEIWEFILKWSLARMSTQRNVNDLSQWTSSNFEELEKILHDLIPHIRWFQISSKDFWRKVSPFEQIFPKQLYKDIIGYYCDPDTLPINEILPLRRPKCLSLSNSVLINRNHLLMIASWIGKSYYSDKDNPYTVNLLYRASRDGFEATRFHELCDNKGPTIMISKLKENDQLIGGYNPLSWQPYSDYKNDIGTWQHTPDSFLFSFTKNEEINSVIARVTNNSDNNYAVSYSSECGPAFGFGWDLIIRHNRLNYCGGSSYPGMDSMNSNLEDYEIFQIIKKQDV
ncbi:BTB/POZ protein [Rhizophagus clarus]|uniref:BTB/POZ protein n=1 Tax=Rhizophagus clarus TaxID=94130 RepID=A0A8H3QRF2_9GLOM|nr:BTB/POZ protein [Rhizophagus clarus]